MKIALILWLLLTPSAFAEGVSLQFEKVTTRFFITETLQQTIGEATVSRHAFTLQAARRIENYTVKVGVNWFINSEKWLAENRYYLDGQFLNDDVNLSFERAYRFQSQVILLGVKGKLEGQRFNSQKMVFDPKANTLAFERIQLFANNKLSRRLHHLVTLD